MRRLVDENDNWTEGARELSNRDVELVIMHNASLLCVEQRAARAIERWRVTR